MKQTQNTGVVSGSYSLARGKAAAVTRESGEVAACSLAPEIKRPDGSHLHAAGPGWAGTEKHRNRC